MTKERIWAPWRVTYITEIIDKKPGCVFCRILKENKDKKNYIILRTRYCFAVLNLYPYNNGHVLVMPLRHVNDISKLKDEERVDLFDLLTYIKELLGATLSPEGYNIGMNLGKVAGAGVPGHLHFHVVPRWKGDVNFMPVTGNIKIISMSLKALYDELCKVHKSKKK